MPAIPAEIDRDPELIGQLSDGSMGALTIDSAQLAEKYGVLGVRFNTLREFYSCVREAMNTNEDPKGCSNVFLP